METNTIVILAVVIICLALVGLNRFHHRQHHYNEEDLRQAVKNILSLQPDHILPRADFHEGTARPLQLRQQRGAVAPRTGQGERLRQI